MSVSHASATQAALDALVNGRNRDPFAVLGPHLDVTVDRTVVRVFQPAARAVALLLPEGELTPMVPLARWVCSRPWSPPG